MIWTGDQNYFLEFTTISLQQQAAENSEQIATSSLQQLKQIAISSLQQIYHYKPVSTSSLPQANYNKQITTRKLIAESTCFLQTAVASKRKKM